jgi:hypothetical protein
MIECSRLIEHQFSLELKTLFELAVKYEKRLISDSDLEESRVKAWRLEEHYKHIDNLKHASSRALICMLYPNDMADDWFMTLDLFVKWCNSVEDHEKEQVEIFRKIFSKHLS